MNAEKLKTLLKSAWPLLLTVIVAVGGSFGVVKITKGDKFEVHVVLPEDADTIFGEAVSLGEDFSDGGRRALRLGGLRLRDAAEGRELFAVFRELHNNPTKLTEAERAADGVSKLDPATIAIAVKIALMVSVAILERTAPNTKTPLDDRLLALLKLFQAKPQAIVAVHKAIVK